MSRRIAPLHLLCVAVFVAMASAACGIVVDDDCPDLDVICPDVVCDDYQQNRDGCSMCACEGDDNATSDDVCWDDGECGGGQRCDTARFCEPAPGCSGDGPCPDACYGRCVDGPVLCTGDDDCAAGAVCAALANTSGGGTGVCVDAGCGSGDVVLPQCPPGSELIFEADACAPTCVSRDLCRELLPQECAATPGCAVVVEGCDPEAGADCPNTERCAAIDDCAARPLAECELTGNCVLKPIGENGGPSPACDPATSSCGDVPIASVVCVPRGAGGTCLGDADCFLGEECQLLTVCGVGCEIDASTGQELCFDQCWSEAGVCAAADQTCFELSTDACDASGRCRLDDTGACAPKSDTCLNDTDCAPGDHCAVIESCPACDPSSSDVDCYAPCFVDGTCVAGTPPPVSCASDADCLGGTCVTVSVCETCGNDEVDANEDVVGPSCELVCYDQGVCVLADPEETDPTGPTLCQLDEDCGPTELCLTSEDVCLDNPDVPDSGCWWECVDGIGSGFDALYCFENADCGEGSSCHFDAEVCLDDPYRDEAACSGWCDGGCAQVQTSAHDPETGQCASFADSCIPPGWVTGC